MASTEQPRGDEHGAAGAPAAPSSCGATCGIGRERDKQKAVARAVAERAYPGLVWTPRAAWLPDEAPVSRDELEEIGAALADVLPARAIVVSAPGRDECDSIFLLAGVHEPSWLEVREGAPGAPRALAETYVRVLVSPLGRYFTLQEVRVTAEPEGDGGAVWVEEKRLVGIEDRRLQLFVKAGQGLLRKKKLVGLDAVFLSERTPDAPGEPATDALGEPPTLWTLLFERTPPGCTRGEHVEPRAERAPG